MMKTRPRPARKSGSASPPLPLATTAAPWPLEERPGFLIRRLHQLHVALFAEETQGMGVTPVQYSLMSALAERGQADQTRLARDVALDRSTTAATLARLEQRGWVSRSRAAEDARAVLCRLTPAGRRMLATMEGGARAAHRRTLERLSPKDAAELARLMRAALGA
jgi:DNA-binding MarR family transcriptional regulator